MAPQESAIGQLSPGFELACRIGAYEWWLLDDRLVWSPGLLHIYGLERAPKAENGFMGVIHADDRVRVEAETSSYLCDAHVTSYSHCFRIVRPDGGIRSILDRGSIERDGTGGVRVVRGINIDVTDMVPLQAAADGTCLLPAMIAERTGTPRTNAATEARLERSEQRLKLALQDSPITVFEHDTELRYQWLFNSKLGYSDDFAIGKTDDEIMDSSIAKPLVQLKRRVLESGTAERHEVIAAAPGKVPEYFDLTVHPRRDQTGRIVGLSCVSTDVTEKKLAAEHLLAAQDMFRRLVEHSPFGIYVVDADFRLIQVSDGAQEVFKTVRPLIGRDFAEVLRIIWPEPFATEAINLFRHTLKTGEPYHAPRTVEQRADIGTTEAYDWKIERMILPDGRSGVVCHFYDLSERQRHEQHIELIMREVDHRSKNMLGVILAIARHTASADVPDFLKRFTERILALSASQDLLVHNEWKSVPLVDLVASQLSHFRDLIGQRIQVSGPPVYLTAAATQSLGMALHELATNAAKYGALSVEGGRVTIIWAVDGDQTAPPQFTMSFVEHDGPAVVAPSHHGFGFEVTTKMVKLSVGGAVAIDYRPTGLEWRLSCPAANIVEA